MVPKIRASTPENMPSFLAFSGSTKPLAVSFGARPICCLGWPVQHGKVRFAHDQVHRQLLGDNPAKLGRSTLQIGKNQAQSPFLPALNRGGQLVSQSHASSLSMSCAWAALAAQYRQTREIVTRRVIHVLIQLLVDGGLTTSSGPWTIGLMRRSSQVTERPLGEAGASGESVQLSG